MLFIEIQTIERQNIIFFNAKTKEYIINIVKFKHFSL